MSNLQTVIRVLKEGRKFVTPTKGEKGKIDTVGIVLSKFIRAIPEFERSIVSKSKRPNGWTLIGSWPTTGRQIYDWKMDVWGERGGDVIVKTNIWSREGGEEGQVWRINIADVDRTIPKFLRKFLIPTIMLMKAKGKKAKE